MADDKKQKTIAEKDIKTTDKEKSTNVESGSVSTKENKDKSETADKKTEQKPETETEKAEKKDILDEIDDGDLILENQRESVMLTPQNAKFFASKGGLISMTLIHGDGTPSKEDGMPSKKDGGDDEFFERVVVMRAFPISNPDEFISVREPDNKKKGKGKEIGMIRRLSDFDEASVRLIIDELDRRYFSPIIQRIYSVKEKFGYSYWESDTSAGRVTFILNNPFSNIRVLEDGRIYINDIDGNSFEIPDPKKLDTASYRKIEIYL